MTNDDPTPIVEWEGKFLRVLKSGRWEYADRKQSSAVAVIVAVTAEDKLILVEQHRIPVGQRVIELPAGLAGDVPGAESETVETAARRELLEETGYEAGEITLLTSGPPSAGLTSEIVTFLRATGLHRVAAGGGEGKEEIQVHEVPLDQVREWLTDKIAEGLLVDPKVYAGLYLALSGEG